MGADGRATRSARDRRFGAWIWRSFPSVRTEQQRPRIWRPEPTRFSPEEIAWRVSDRDRVRSFCRPLPYGLSPRPYRPIWAGHALASSPDDEPGDRRDRPLGGRFRLSSVLVFLFGQRAETRRRSRAARLQLRYEFSAVPISACLSLFDWRGRRRRRQAYTRRWGSTSTPNQAETLDPHASAARDGGAGPTVWSTRPDVTPGAGLFLRHERRTTRSGVVGSRARSRLGWRTGRQLVDLLVGRASPPIVRQGARPRNGRCRRARPDYQKEAQRYSLQLPIGDVGVMVFAPFLLLVGDEGAIHLVGPLNLTRQWVLLETRATRFGEGSAAGARCRGASAPPASTRYMFSVLGLAGILLAGDAFEPRAARIIAAPRDRDWQAMSAGRGNSTAGRPAIGNAHHVGAVCCLP